MKCHEVKSAKATCIILSAKMEEDLAISLLACHHFGGRVHSSPSRYGCGCSIIGSEWERLKEMISRGRTEQSSLKPGLTTWVSLIRPRHSEENRAKREQ
jgi:hypothetical protein